MKLFTIGDSISQGFMSLAAARTELSFSTLLARSLGLRPGTDDYTVPMWGVGGLPINIENLLRHLHREYGKDIFGPIEWSAAFVSVARFLAQVEDHYERGPGNIALPQAGRHAFHPNVAVAGFTVADAWMVTPQLCLQRIASDPDGEDDNLALPNRRFERTAHAVLNPSRDAAFADCSQLEWLRRHHVEGEGVENLILWLGSNNALGTIVRMGLKPTRDGGKRPLDMTLDERDQYNLWSPQHFEEEFAELMRRTHEILRSGETKSRVFIATVPAVTIAPLASGVGRTRLVADPFNVLPQATYFERYKYFVFARGPAGRGANQLTFEEVYEIDSTIARYNQCIRTLVQQYDGRDGIRYVLVDIADQLLRLAYRRNDGKPTYTLPTGLQAYVDRTGKPVNTIYYTVGRDAAMTAGGVFSLDGVHPSAIGHGLIATEFRDAMIKAGVGPMAPLDWDAIVASDSLWTRPIALMPELYDNTDLAQTILDLLRLP